ncbi:MAG TPA: hypothetical protein VIY10_22155 [Solirubrobacteraceae bacterium]
MADQLGSGTVAGVSAEGGQLAGASTTWSPPEPYHGRTVSWVAVSLIMVAFLVGGLGLVFGPTWWVFYTGIGIAAIGGLLALATDIFADWY